MLSRIILQYGLISGLVGASGYTLFMALKKIQSAETMNAGELIGSIFLFLSMAVVFFGLRSIRGQNDGVLSFKAAFLNGMSIVFISSIIYVAGWMLLYPILLPDFVDQYQEAQITQLESENLDSMEMKEKIEEMKAFNENYKRPHIMAAYTFLEIFPLGLVTVLISSLILRRRD